MKRVAILIITLAFIFCVAACGDHAPQKTSRSEPINSPTIAKVVNMNASGKIVDITDTTLKIERTVEGNVDTFEFVLEKPVEKFKLGNKVLVRYITVDDKNVLKEIALQQKPKHKKIMQRKNVISLELEFLRDMFLNNHG
jgi:ribosomal protein S1